MAGRMLDQGVDHLWLDTTAIADFDVRFPTIAAALDRAGLDPTKEWLPIAPAAHYMIGGVITDLDGATARAGLWAAGEVAATGVHGANRLGSNSLLEGMVFAARVVEAVAGGKDGPDATGLMAQVPPSGRSPREDPPTGVIPRIGPGVGVKGREGLQQEMSAHAGLRRDASSLAQARAGTGVRHRRRVGALEPGHGGPRPHCCRRRSRRDTRRAQSARLPRPF
jgi:L-aspartate oxidase